MSVVEMRSQTFNGRTLHFTNVTEFLVQTSKRPGSKSGYENRQRIVGNLTQAVMYFNSYNIGNGYKKRLVMVTGDGRNVVLARATS